MAEKQKHLFTATGAVEVRNEVGRPTHFINVIRKGGGYWVTLSTPTPSAGDRREIESRAKAHCDRLNKRSRR